MPDPRSSDWAKAAAAEVTPPGVTIDTNAGRESLEEQEVAVVKDPLGFSILDPDHPEVVLGLHPDIDHWAVAGHSLGGTWKARTSMRPPRAFDARAAQPRAASSSATSIAKPWDW